MEVPSRINLREVALGLERVVAVNYYGRSGSVFLQSLFDNHPGVITTPGFYMTLIYEFYSVNNALPPMRLVERFMEQFAILFDARSPFKAWSGVEGHGVEMGFTKMGPDQNEVLNSDRQVFFQSMFDILGQEAGPVPRKLFFQAVHVAYQMALGGSVEIDRKQHIIFPLHQTQTSRNALQFIEDFPEAKYVHTIREPLQSLGSFHKHYPARSHLEPSLFGGIPVHEKVRASSRSVKLEDLHANPRLVMERLCLWLDIPWDELLLESTFQGLEWWGDRSSVKLNGFSRAAIAKNNDDIFPLFDKVRLWILLAPKYEKWKYDVPQWCRSVAAKILVLPSLLVPLHIELKSVFYARQARLLELRQQIQRKNHGSLTLLKYVYWLLGGRYLTSWIIHRRYLLQSWLQLLSGSRRELELLDLPCDKLR